MSAERELLKEFIDFVDSYEFYPTERSVIWEIVNRANAILAQPEQEPVTDKSTETAMVIMPNGVCVSNVYAAYEEGRKSVMSEQQAEAWIIVNKETGYRTQVSDLTPFLYHREIFEVIPLYTEPPKRTPLSNEEIDKGLNGKNGFENWYDDRFVDGVRFAEKHHGIGGGE